MADASHDQLVDITSLIERVGSIFSLLGSFFIIVTFSCSSAFHQKPINRLVFYASFGNVLCNVGTLMAGSYTRFPGSVGCQLQGALIQMFMPADAYWTLAMAVNVWLTFYHKVDAIGLRRMEKWYLLLCYGCPLVPAVVFVFIENPTQGRVYGDAKLWCWISPSWSPFRFALFYGPVWIAILITFFIYARAGRDIYAKRKTLRDFSSGSGHEPDFLSMTDPFSTKTTEIIVTSEPATDQHQFQHANHNAIPTWRQRLSLVGTAHTTDVSSGQGLSQPAATERPSTYSITISADAGASSKPAAQRLVSTDTESRYGRKDRSRSRSHSTSSTARSFSSIEERHTAPPPTSPPPYQISHPTSSSIPGTPSHQRPQTASAALASASARQQRSRTAAVMAANNAAWSYTKCAMLFFTAMIITWLPSTTNRLYNLASGGNSSPALEYMTAIVLPIQGFWNCVIYCVTSREAVRLFFLSDVPLMGRMFSCCWGGGRGGPGASRGRFGDAGGRYPRSSRHGRAMDLDPGQAREGDDGQGLQQQQQQQQHQQWEMLPSPDRIPQKNQSKTVTTGQRSSKALMLKSLVKGQPGRAEEQRVVKGSLDSDATRTRKNSATDSTTELRPSQ